MECKSSINKTVAKLRDLNDNHELSADQQRTIEAAIEELEAVSKQGRITPKAIQNAIIRIALWTLFDDVF